MPSRRRKNSRELKVESRELAQRSPQSEVDGQQSTVDSRQSSQEERENSNAQREPVALPPDAPCHPERSEGSQQLVDSGKGRKHRDSSHAKSSGLRMTDALQDSSRAKTSALRITDTLTPALQLLPYQRRWVEDDSQLKIVVKARQIGYSFVASIRALLECLKKKTTWIFLSKGERQSRLLMEKVQEHVQSCGILARACESTYFEGTLIKQLEVRFANGSVIYGLPANPDTARGYSGNVTLDEFAFHSDADKIYSALFPTITRGYCLEVVSTPNGQQG